MTLPTITMARYSDSGVASHSFRGRKADVNDT